MCNFASGLRLFYYISKFSALHCMVDLLNPTSHCHFDMFGGYSLSRTFSGMKNAGRSALLLAHKTTKHPSRCRRVSFARPRRAIFLLEQRLSTLSFADHEFSPVTTEQITMTYDEVHKADPRFFRLPLLSFFLLLPLTLSRH
jgi:hypothetical protein